LAKLGLEPLLRLGMRLGEGSGAALAVNVIRAALAAHAQMATFGEAGVSEAE
jgi:nicotinate-nucleotide--dimethylbenzimidazole phosphoribosyltransferase